jgi:hypothetical protein
MGKDRGRWVGGNRRTHTNIYVYIKKQQKCTQKIAQTAKFLWRMGWNSDMTI